MNPPARSSAPSPSIAWIAALAALSALVATPLAAQFGDIGLSGVGGQLFANEDLLFFDPEAGDEFARVLAVGDFNGDGADDLATGIPLDDGLFGFSPADCGAVFVRYGSPGSGLTASVVTNFLGQFPIDSPDPAEAGDNFGGALAACDFDGDGFDDLAVGVPNEDVGTVLDAGAVAIYYGSPSGLPALPGQFLTQATSGIPGDPETLDFFGFSLACGRFDGDMVADLAIGAPGEALEGDEAAFAGVVIVLDGSASGLSTNGSASFHQNSPGIEGVAEHWDLFAWSLAVGDFDADGFDDLVLGIPGEDNTANGFDAGRGAVQFLFGSASGFSDRDLVRAEGALGGVARDGDRFGYAVATGDFDGDGHADAAVGAPFDDVNSGGLIVDAGQVIALYGAPGGIDLDRTEIWIEDAIHCGGCSESGDLFGRSLASADFDGDGRDDLAIGEPGEFVLVPQDGMVTVVMGSPTGLTAARRHGLTAGRDGNPGVVNQANRNYGFALAAGDFDGDGNGDLAIGAPREDVDVNGDGVKESNVGASVVLYGSLFANGFDNGDPGYWSSHVP